MCDQADTQWASSIQAKAMGGSLEKLSRPDPVLMRASGDRSKKCTSPACTALATFSRCGLVMLVCRHAPLKPAGRPVTYSGGTALNVIYYIEMPLLTGQKVGIVGHDFPTFILEASRLQITFKHRALILYFHFNRNRINTEML